MDEFQMDEFWIDETYLRPAVFERFRVFVSNEIC